VSHRWAKESVDDVDKSASFVGNAPPRRSTELLGAFSMRAETWEPLDGICGPCDRIAFSYIPHGSATVHMSFSGTAGGPPRDLLLRFTQVIVLSGEDECPGGFVPAPAIKSLPKIGGGDHPTWTFPLLKIVDSEPLKQYQSMRPQNLPIAHFFMISLDNLVHVIASSDVHAAWCNVHPVASA